MKIFNKITTCTFLATMMVTQAQAIELVKVEPVAKLSITEAAKESLNQSMKLHISEPAPVNVIFNGQKPKVSYLSLNNKKTLSKTNVTAE
jgi:hypothetical protein